jgi:hypothetical protein
MRRFRISTVLLLGTLTALLTGCSRNPMSPDPTGAAQDGAQMLGAQIEDLPADVGGGGSPGTATTALAVGSEGRLTVGRFTLDLHKNSLKMPATITLRVSSDDATEVEIVVVPAAANDFKVPVTLTANMGDRPGTDFATAWMEYSENGNWERCADVSTHTNHKTVVAKMKELSNCRVTEDMAGTAAETEQAKKK